MTTVLRRIADHPINRIDELLPWRLFLAQGTGGLSTPKFCEVWAGSEWPQ